MYNLTVTNNYSYTVIAGKREIAAGETFEVTENLGNIILTIPGLGSLNLLDVGEKHLESPSTKTRGVLLSYQGNECIYQYEGEGNLRITLTDIGQAQVTGDGDITLMRFDSFLLNEPNTK